MSDNSDSDWDWIEELEQDDTKVKCNLCGVLIPNCEYNIDQHLEGMQHDYKDIRRIMSLNGICKDDDESYCKPCKINFPYTTEDIRNHVDSYGHVKWINEMEEIIDAEGIDLAKYLSSGKNVDRVYCKLCPCKVECTLKCVDIHVKGKPHRNARVRVVMPQNGLFDCEDDEEVWCKPCDSYMGNNLEDILYHVDYDEAHKKGLNDIENFIEDELINIDKYLSNLNEHRGYCNRCKVYIPYSYNNFVVHVNGFRHQKKVGLPGGLT